MRLGLNVIAQADFNPDQTFANLYLNSRQPQALADTTRAPALDALGWPIEDFRLVIYSLTALREWSGGGTYAIKFAGKARLAGNGGSFQDQVYDAATNTTTARLVVPPGTFDNIFIDFADTQRDASAPTGTGVGEIFIMRPTYDGSPTPHDYGEFLSRNYTAMVTGGGYASLRFMDMLGTNSYDVDSLPWGQRSLPKYPSQASGYTGAIGTAIELCVRICNLTGKDFYYCMPDPADADYILKAMQTIAFGSDGVNPYTSPQGNPVYLPLRADLKLYIEWTNEPWNDFFQQRHRIVRLAQAEQAAGMPYAYDGVTNEYYWASRRVGRKIAEVSKVARQVFGDAAMMTRVRPVLMGQDEPSNIHLKLPLEYIRDVQAPADGITGPYPAAHYLYAAGAGGYHGWVLTDTTGNTSADAILAGGLRPDTDNTFTRPAYIASFGVKSIIYEASLNMGQDQCTPFSFGFNLDPRLRPLVKAFYDQLDQAGYDEVYVFQAGNYSQARSAEPGDLAVGPRYLAARDFTSGTSPVQPGSTAASGFYFPVGYIPLGYFPVGYFPVAQPIAQPFYFEAELSDWLADKLGLPVIPDRLPQQMDLPGLTYHTIDGDSPPLLTGPNGFAWAMVQFDAWAIRAIDALAIQRRLYDVLTGYHAAMGLAQGVVALPRRQHGGYDAPEDASDDGVFRRSRDFRISWNDPGPAG